VHLLDGVIKQLKKSYCVIVSTVHGIGARVYMACRSLGRAQEAVDDIVNQTGVSPTQLPVMQLDLASFKSIRSFALSFKQSKICFLSTMLIKKFSSRNEFA